MVLLLLLALSLLLWLIFRELAAGNPEQQPAGGECPTCHSQVDANWHLCPSCQQMLTRTCPSCARRSARHHLYCPYCGTKRPE